MFRFPTDSIRVSFQLLAEVGAYAVFAYLLWGINKWISLFAILVCFSSIFPQYDKATFLASHAVFYGLVWYYIVYEVGNREHILNCMCIVALFNVLFLTLQFFNICPFFEPISGDMDMCTGLMANQNEVSAVLALCFPAFLRKKWAYLIPVILIGLAFAKSFGGVLAVGVGVLWYLWRINKALSVAVSLVGMGLFLIIDTPGITHRLETWIIATKLYIQHPIIGCGIGHWKYVFANIDVGGHGVRMATAHNEYVQAIFEMGFMSILLIIGFVTTLLKRAKTEIFVVVSLVILINCFVNFPLHIAVTAYLILTWFALIDRGYNGTNKF